MEKTETDSRCHNLSGSVWQTGPLNNLISTQLRFTGDIVLAMQHRMPAGNTTEYYTKSHVA